MSANPQDHDDSPHTAYDVIVIGGGPAGENAADYATRGSDRTAVIIERELLGGECSYFACMPSKALLRPLDVAAAAAHLGGLGPLTLDREALLARRDAWVSGYDDSRQVGWAQGVGIDVVRGVGRLTGDREVTVTRSDGTARVLRARDAVVLATGSVPVIPETYAAVAPWTSRDATGVVDVPESIAIIGGGVVACEAARWMQALGSRVTLVVRGDRVLPRAEDFVSSYVVDGLRLEGIDVRLSTEIASATRESVSEGFGRPHGGPVTLTVADGSELVAAEVLVATGRRPATDDLGLDVVGVDRTDLHGRTDGGPLPEWLWTVGDVNAVAPLTHWGKYQARLVGRRIAERAEGRPGADAATTPHAPVPQVVFTDPQVAWVGLTEPEARVQGEVIVVDSDYTSAAGAGLLRDDATGRARLVIDAASRRLLGATFVGPDVAELLHSATVAITGELTVDTLNHAVPSYPTASEIWLRLLDQVPPTSG